MNSYRDLQVWQKSMSLVEHVYQTTAAFPLAEQYGLTAQMRRSAVSIPSNIAEGYMRGKTKEYIRFLRVSFGSGAELETQLLLAHRLGFIDEAQYKVMQEFVSEVMKMLNVLIKKLIPKS